MLFEQRANYILEGHLPIAESVFRTRRPPIERRAKPRSNDALPARVWGVDSEDQPFSFDCLVDNISGSGLYLRLPHRVKFSRSEGHTSELQSLAYLVCRSLLDK